MMHRVHVPRSFGSTLVATLAALCAAAPAPAGAGPDGAAAAWAYVVEIDNDLLARHRLDQPGTLETVAPLISPNQEFIGGCETLPSSPGLLYCIESPSPPASAAVFTVDLFDGTVTPLGLATADPFSIFTDLATDPTTGTLYATATGISFSLLYTIDAATGDETLVGEITNVAFVTAAAFDNAGQLYVYEADNGNLLAVDKTTGAGTVIGPTGFPSANNDASLDFAGDGTCYYWRLDGASGSIELHTCDPATGAATLVGAVGDVFPGGTPQITAAVVVELVFADGFESGDLSAWSASVP